MYKPLTAHTPDQFAAMLNTHEMSGYRIQSSGVGEGVWWAVLYREEDWSYPFRMACVNPWQAGLVESLCESLEVATDPNITDVDRAAKVKKTVGPCLNRK